MDFFIRYFTAIIIAFTLNFSVQGMKITEHEYVNVDLLSNQVVFEKKTSPDFIDFFRKSVEKIQKNPVGNLLFQLIKSNLANFPDLTVFIEDTTGNSSFHTGFVHNQDLTLSTSLHELANISKLHICINMDDVKLCAISGKKELIDVAFTESEVINTPQVLITPANNSIEVFPVSSAFLCCNIA